jgi:hypothetical protein
MKGVDPDLLAAYVQTTYWVSSQPQPIGLRIGQKSALLARLLAARQVSQWAFVTAWNPRSQLRSDWYNIGRENALLREVCRRGLQWLPGLAAGDGSDWPAEPAMLVLGMSRPEARRLGRRFRQNAVVVGERGGVAQLVWCELRR